MKGFAFDPSRLRGSSEEQLRRGYATAARMLRAMLAQAGAELALAVLQGEAQTVEEEGP